VAYVEAAINLARTEALPIGGYIISYIHLVSNQIMDIIKD
jgi:hypothetical protein